ncbi:MAG: NADH-quinone oxidoreductase subunit NuoN [Rhodospirillales bacterium]
MMDSSMIPNLAPATPEIFMAIAIMGLLMLGVFQRADSNELTIKVNSQIWLLSIVTLVLAALLVTTVSGDRMLTFGQLFVTDSFAVYAKILVLMAAALTLVISKPFLEMHEMARFEYGVLIVFACLGMMMMISANDLMTLYVGLEMQSLSLYVIAAFRRDEQRSTEAGLKYFVLGAIASGMLLYGSSLVYGFTGTTSFDGLAAGFADNVPSIGVVVGLVFIIAGLAFKVSAVPFHMWTPDVYEGAPTPVTAFFAVAPKIAAIMLFLRVMTEPFGALADQWQQIIIFISVASMVLGALAAINQTSIKRLMAYSSIGHVGYALIGLAVADETGIRGILIYMAIYLFMNVGTFACILCMRRGERMVEQISDLAGLSKSNPMLATAITIMMFSMAGIPPLAGFFGKYFIFVAAIDGGLYGLAVIGVLTSVIGAFYYLRVVKVCWFDDPVDTFDRPIPVSLRVVIAGSSLLVVLFILYPSPLIDSAAYAASALIGG